MRCCVAVPFLGIIVQLKRGHALPVFGFWEFQSPWPADRNDRAEPFSDVHGWLADALLILAGVHAVRGAGAPLRVGATATLRRMLPRRAARRCVSP